MLHASTQTRLAVVISGLCGLLALPPDLAAAPSDPGAGDVPAQRPRIGLVLAGGGAKGGAHVGVLKVLEEQRVPIDCIAGTSMGALVGAGYASGLPAAELEAFITGIDWQSVVGGVGRRSLQPIEQKRLETAASAAGELGFKEGQIVTPGGLTNTSAIDDVLRTYVARARMEPDFDRLPIPYRAVATDMVTGDMVVLKSGDLATAMRASMAIPGAFAPVTLGKYILADGGMVRNIPVDIARETCADVVIVVNLVEPATPPERLVQATQLLARSMDVMLVANERMQLATLTERDILIDVPTGDIGTADFTRISETIPLGESAARLVTDRLASFAVPEQEYSAWRRRVTTEQAVETRVADVRVEGLTRVNAHYLKTFTKVRSGDTVDIAAISADAGRMSALADIESVAYRFEGDLDNPALVWLPTEATIGPNVLRPSLGMHASGGGDLNFLLGVQHVRHWLNPRGGEWRNNLQLGYETLLTTSFYQPFDMAQRYFVEPALFGIRGAEDVYVDGDRIARYSFVDVGGRVDFGVNVGRTAQMRLGYVTTKRRAQATTGPAQLPEVDARDAGLAVSAFYDSRNADTFATEGLAAAIEYLHADDALGGDREWERIEAGVRTSIPIGKNFMWVGVAGGADLGDELPADRAFSLGGQRTLPAYELDELRARSYVLAGIDFFWRLKELVAVKNQAIYAGLGVQAAGVYDRIDRVDDGEIVGLSGYLGGPTPIGSLVLGAGVASDSWSVWLSLGRPVGNGSILDNGLFR